MATDFDNAILSSDGFIPTKTNTPLDKRTRIESINEMPNIPNPFVGMIVYVSGEDKYYKIKTLKSKIIGGITVQNSQVDSYEVFESGSGGGESITVDSSLSDSSTNPVQNKVIKAELDKKAAKSDIPSLSGYATTQSVNNAIGNAKSELNSKINENASSISSLRTKVSALSGIDSPFVGYFDSESKLPAQTSPAWALVGNLNAARPYAYYVTGNVPTGYSNGWNDLSAVLGAYDFTDLEGYAKKVDLASLGERCKGGVKSIYPTFKLGIPQQDGTIDESGALHITRAFVRLENFQSISTFDIELSEGWHCYIYGCDSSWKFTDPDDLIKNSNAPLTGVVNKGYDHIVVVVKYGSDGTQDLTNLLPNLNFEIKYSAGAYSPAAPYNEFVELSNKVSGMLGGMQLDLSSDFKLGTPQQNGSVTDSNIRAYYHWENFDKFSQFDIELSEGWHCYIYGCDSSWKFTDPDDLIKNSNAPLTGVVNKGYSHAVIGLKYGSDGTQDLTNLLPNLRFVVKVSGTIKDAITERSKNVNTYNSNKQPILSSLCRTQDPVSYSTEKCFVFAQIADTHGENMLVKRAIEYINDVDNSVIDIIIHTGDIQRKSFKDEEISIAGNRNKYKEYISYMSDSIKPAFTCLGNHDQNKATNVSEQYERWMKYMVNKGMLELGREIISGTSWYYKDFMAYKIRLIVLNSYDPLYDGFYSGPGNDMDYNNVQYSQAQISFFADALDSVPSGYTVIVAQHAYFNLTISNPDWSSTKTVDSGTYKNTPSIMSADPVLDIIDAYQRKAVINKSYSYTNQTVANKLGTVSANKDFTASKGTFGFCIAGHNHGDWMGSSVLYPSVKMVVMVGGVLTQPDSDLGRDYNGKSQDAINVYVVNTKLRKVHVVRIGADYTIDGKMRLVTTLNF